MSRQPYHYNADNDYNAPPPPVVVRGEYVSRDDGMGDYDYYRRDYGAGGVVVGGADGGAKNDGGIIINPSNRDAMVVDGEYERCGEVQPRRCNDFSFALLFCVHLVVIIVASSMYAPRMMNDISSSYNDNGADGGRDLTIADSSSSSSSSMSTSSNDDVNARFATWTIWTARRCILSLSSFASSSIGTHASNDDSYRHRILQDANDDGDNDDEDVSGTNDLGDMILLLSASASIALLLSSLVLGVMIRHADMLIRLALLFNVVCSVAFAIGAIFISPFAAIVGVFLFVLNVCYAYVVWGHIPWAASNLIVATTSVKSNLGLAIFAYSSLPVMFGWNCVWLVSFVSTVYVSSGCDATGNCANETPAILVFSMLLSYHWTYQVIKNVLHVTVAGVVGTWWFVPTEATSFCSAGVRDSFVRSITTSFGSICLGSLLVAIIEALRSMVRNARENGDGGVLLCLAECLLACLQDTLEYFNMWAFVFVGLYGYTFVEAGKNVMTLFRIRGWTTIITDNLAQGVLGLVSVAIGLITGLIALVIANTRGMVFGDELGASAAAFFVGFVTGAVLTITLLTLVSSAVNTVIVCYAEAPREFEINHPKLSHDMRTAWRQTWPDEFRY